MTSKKAYSQKFKITAITLFSLGAVVPTAAARNTQDASRLALSIGYYDVLDDQDGVDFRLEYHPALSILREKLRPWIGLELTSQGSLWAGGGLLYDWEFKDNWHLSPSLGIGLYSDGGSDVDLDYPVQFRTQLELSYEFKDESRLGVSLSHMSNAGLGNSNPGTEVIGLYWHTPFSTP